MQRTLIIMLVVTVLIAIFALQNSAEVEINLWFWSARTSIALVVILAFAIGALAGILFSIPGLNRRKRRKAAANAARAGEIHDDPLNTSAKEKRSGPIDPQVDEFEDL